MPRTRRDLFTTIRSEGALLPPDLLQRIAEGDRKVPGLTPDAYHLTGNEKLNEAASHSWNRLLGVWAAFQAGASGLKPTDPGTGFTRDKWLLPLFQELGYGRLPVSRTLEVGGKPYAISHVWYHTPIHLVGRNVDLDHRTPGVAGAARTSPHGLLQEFLNRSEEHVWGFLSNGLKLRILRESKSLTRRAHVEFDLAGMMDGQVYSDFALLWLLCHQSRVEADQPVQCWLEKWAEEARQEGTRALDTLRDGVEKAIEVLGRGFLGHPANGALVEKLRAGTLTTQDYYRQLLRAVYRLIFIFVAEDRDLLLVAPRGSKERERYLRYYSMDRIRSLAERRRGTPHGDLWQGLVLVFQKLGSDSGCPELGLPTLGSYLWSPETTPDLDCCSLANAAFLEAIRNLAFTVEAGIRRVIDYRNLGPEELGSVYESLLELHPDLNVDAPAFTLRVGAGHERKTSGSYYTHDSLVQCLLDSALEPVMDEAVRGKTGEEAAKALLALKVCDLAVGSGHFLIAAAHRLARRVAAARTGDEEPSPEATRTALRDVIGRCLYGVDVNPMAAELCRVNLWLEALEPGKPLSFLDHHIRVGNSLLGATPDLVAAGLPDDAFTVIEGDDKKACAVLKNRNKAERAGVGPLFAQQDAEIQARLQLAAAALEGLPDDRPEHIRAKELAFRCHEQTEEYRQKKQLADAWCAAFVIKKHFREPSRESSASGITQGHLNDLAAGRPLPTDLAIEAERLSGQYQFFHWHLAFPEVFARGGFDCVLGNPPWDMQEVRDNEFFAASFPEILSVKSAKDKAAVLMSISEAAPALWQAYQEYVRVTYGQRHLMASNGRFPLSSSGRMNLYRLFLETGHTLVGLIGRVGMVVPSGFASDSFSQEHFSTLHGEGRLVSLYDFENRLGLFPGVHSRYRFCLLAIGGKGACAETDFVFFAHSPSDLADADRHIRLSQQAVSVLNPLSRTAPLFRTRRDYVLTLRMQKAGPIIGRSEGERGWVIRPTLMFMMNAGMKGHRTAEELEAAGCQIEGNRYLHASEVWLPFYEGKMVGMYDHRAASIRFDPTNRVRRNQPVALSFAEHQDPGQLALPMFWVSSADVAKRCGSVPRWCLSVKDVTSSTNERTSIAAMLAGVALTDSLPWLATPQNANMTACLLANLNSHALDYIARQKVAGLHLRGHYLGQLPVIAVPSFESPCPWAVPSGRLDSWLLPRVLELTHTAWDLEPFAQDCGWPGAPFRWDEDRRSLLRCELDAAFFHLYLPADNSGAWRLAEGEVAEDLARLKASLPTPRDAVAYIMDTFPIVRRKDEEKWGEYRTKRVILEIYDAMQGSIRTGRPYQTRLDPPPADPSCCHPSKEVRAQ